MKSYFLAVLYACLLFCLGCQKPMRFDVWLTDSWRTPDLDFSKYQQAVVLSDHSEKDFIALAFAEDLMKRGMNVVDRHRVEDIIREQIMVRQNFADLSDKEKAIKLGRLANAQIVFLFRDGNWSETNDLLQTGIFAQGTCRAIDTATGQIVWVGIAAYSTSYVMMTDDIKKLKVKDPDGMYLVARRIRVKETINKVCKEMVDSVYDKNYIPRDFETKKFAIKSKIK